VKKRVEKAKSFSSKKHKKL